MKITYTCRLHESGGLFTAMAERHPFTTTDVAALKQHQIEAFGDGLDARNHLLDIVTRDNNGRLISLDGMCLPDAIIDLEKGTVRWFLDREENETQPKGRRL